MMCLVICQNYPIKIRNTKTTQVRNPLPMILITRMTNKMVVPRKKILKITKMMITMRIRSST